MSIKPDHVVVIAVVAGALVGGLIGMFIGSARTTGVVGALLGLVLGCLLTAIPPVRSGPPRALADTARGDGPGGAL